MKCGSGKGAAGHAASSCRQRANKKPISAQSASRDVTSVTTQVVGENLDTLDRNLLAELTFDDWLLTGLAGYE